MKTQKLGRFKSFNYCRLCKSTNLYRFIDLGYQPLAGGFLTKQELKKEKYYPLSLSFCRNCFLVQTTAVIDKDRLFKEYFYHSSAINTLSLHFSENAKILNKFFANPSKTTVLEIGCNDSNFLDEMSKKKFKTLGIDPARNIINPLVKKGKPIINDYFSKKRAKTILSKYGKMDLIVSTNTLAHIEDMNNIFEGIYLLLKDKGLLYFENHYLGNLIKETQYDMIYHEHLYYYSLMALTNFLKEHDMEVFDIRKISTHGGSMGFFVQKKGGFYKVSKKVKDVINWEKRNGFNDDKTFKSFSENVKKQKNELLKTVRIFKKEQKVIAGYGASGRGTVISNYTGLGKNFLDYVIDDSSAKQGFYTPGVHLPIIPSNLNSKNRPDYIVLFAWTFYKEILKRNKRYKILGGKFITPLPKVKII